MWLVVRVGPHCQSRCHRYPRRHYGLYAVNFKFDSGGDSQTTPAIIPTDSRSLVREVKSGMGSQDLHVSVFDIHPRKLPWVYCPGHAGFQGDDRADRLAGGKATVASGSCFERLEVLRSLRHCHAKDIIPSTAWMGEA